MIPTALMTDASSSCLGQTVTITDVTVVQGELPDSPNAAWKFTIKFKFAQGSTIPNIVQGYAVTAFPTYPQRRKPSSGSDPEWNAQADSNGYYYVVVDFDPVQNNDSGDWIFKLYSQEPGGGTGQVTASIDTDGKVTQIFP